MRGCATTTRVQAFAVFQSRMTVSDVQDIHGLVGQAAKESQLDNLTRAKVPESIAFVP
jgi:hypothetical protein